MSRVVMFCIAIFVCLQAYSVPTERTVHVYQLSYLDAAYVAQLITPLLGPHECVTAETLVSITPAAPAQPAAKPTPPPAADGLAAKLVASTQSEQQSEKNEGPTTLSNTPGVTTVEGAPIDNLLPDTTSPRGVALEADLAANSAAETSPTGTPTGTSAGTSASTPAGSASEGNTGTNAAPVNSAPTNVANVAPADAASGANTSVVGGMTIEEGMVIKKPTVVQPPPAPTQTIFVSSVNKHDTITPGKPALNEPFLRGGNRIFVTTADERSWQRLHDILELIDTPQDLVFIEAALIDVEMTTTSMYGSQTRNPHALFPDQYYLEYPAQSVPGGYSSTPVLVPGGLGFYAAHLAPYLQGYTPIGGVTPPNTLQQDILQLVDDPNNPGTSTSIAALLTDPSQAGSYPGSFIISATDSSGATQGIWWLIQLLEQQFTIEVLSHPTLMARNHTPAREIINDIRRACGVGTETLSSVVVHIVDLPAPLDFMVTPHVKKNDLIELDIALEADHFVVAYDATIYDGSDAVCTSTAAVHPNLTRKTRGLKTQCRLKEGNIVACGGIKRTEYRVNRRATPLMAEIPLIGALFQREVYERVEKNLLILMQPFIIKPGQPDFARVFKQLYAQVAAMELDAPFDQLKDPLTYFFFGNPQIATTETEYFCSEAVNSSLIAETRPLRYARVPHDAAAQIQYILAQEQLHPLTREKTCDI